MRIDVLKIRAMIAERMMGTVNLEFADAIHCFRQMGLKVKEVHVPPHLARGLKKALVKNLWGAGIISNKHLDKQPWIKVNVDEITRFPKAKHDDTVDVASMAVAYFGRMASSARALEALGKL